MGAATVTTPFGSPLQALLSVETSCGAAGMESTITVMLSEATLPLSSTTVTT